MFDMKTQDKIRGSLFGGAVGDALGYAVEFDDAQSIFTRYGRKGITEYALDQRTGKALISDDTQMTLFTANGLLVGDTRGCVRGIRACPRVYVEKAYLDWYFTQMGSYEERSTREQYSWLCDVRELYARRAPGNTCLCALRAAEQYGGVDDYIAQPRNNSKGCGGVMRVAPVAMYDQKDLDNLDMEAAQIAAITHGHSLGYMPAAVLCHIINRIVFTGMQKMCLKDMVLEAKDTAQRLFRGDAHLQEFCDILDRAVLLSDNEESDLKNIKALGEGWVAEEALAIAIYCSLRYVDDFDQAIIAAVNHSGDSDSTGAITGNILGAVIGYEAIHEKWKKDLECADIILEMADDLCDGCQISECDDDRDPRWAQKYLHMHSAH